MLSCRVIPRLSQPLAYVGRSDRALAYTWMASSLLLLLAKVAPSFMKKSNEKRKEEKMDR